jgi:Polysaccharide deacetylase
MAVMVKRGCEAWAKGNRRRFGAQAPILASFAAMLRQLSLWLLCAVTALMCGCGGSSSSTTTSSSAPHHTRPHAKPAAPAPNPGFVRNATPQPDWRPYTGPVPILVYHDLGTPPAGDSIPGLYVSDSDFSAEMQWLHQQGYQAVTLDEVMSAWFHGGRLPAKPIVITFDNGYIPQATFAPSVMSQYGWPGVLNEITENHLATWRLAHLVSIGWEIDSHSLTHPDLTTAPPAQLRSEVVDSRRFLQSSLHIPVNSFCYPSNRYNAAVVAAVKAAGYTNALTENAGFATRADPFVLDRFEIEGGVSQLAADLSRG